METRLKLRRPLPSNPAWFSTCPKYRLGLFHSVTGPPNYGEQPAKYGPMCYSCVHWRQPLPDVVNWRDGKCGKYKVEASHWFICDDWKLSPGYTPHHDV